jgi:hypothetical protein
MVRELSMSAVGKLHCRDGARVQCPLRAGRDNLLEGLKAGMRSDNLKVEFWKSELSGS